VRLVIVSTPVPDRVQAGDDLTEIPKNYSVRDDVVGTVVELDGNNYVVRFAKGWGRFATPAISARATAAYGAAITSRVSKEDLALKPKPQGRGLEIKSFTGNDGKSYLVFRTPRGAFHVFREVEAKEAARQCGATAAAGKNTQTMWKSIWKSNKT
jgi:hypothetical protein